MNMQHFFRIIRKGALVATIVAIVCVTNGCGAISQHVASLGNAAMIRMQTHQDLASIRRETREALAQQEEEARRIAAERDIQEARLAAERQRLEVEFCQANQEALQQRIKENVRQTVESKVAFNVEHGMEVGELEVDVEQLKELMEQREKEAPQQPLRDQPLKQPCTCCDRPCGCDEGLTRRHCPRCSQKPCEAEKKCGGEEALTQLGEQPLKRPLRPAEIPMKLPVRMTFGFQRPELEAARIRRVPNLPEQPLKQPCDRCRNGSCQCNPPCVGHAPGVSVDMSPSDEGATTPTSTMPPAPVPDLEARRTPNLQPGWPTEANVKPAAHSMRNYDVASNRKSQSAPISPATRRR